MKFTARHPDGSQLQIAPMNGVMKVQTVWIAPSSSSAAICASAVSGLTRSMPATKGAASTRLPISSRRPSASGDAAMR